MNKIKNENLVFEQKQPLWYKGKSDEAIKIIGL